MPNKRLSGNRNNKVQKINRQHSRMDKVGTYNRALLLVKPRPLYRQPFHLVGFTLFTS